MRGCDEECKGERWSIPWPCRDQWHEGCGGSLLTSAGYREISQAFAHRWYLVVASCTSQCATIESGVVELRQPGADPSDAPCGGCQHPRLESPLSVTAGDIVADVYSGIQESMVCLQLY